MIKNEERAGKRYIIYNIDTSSETTFMILTDETYLGISVFSIDLNGYFKLPLFSYVTLLLIKYNQNLELTPSQVSKLMSLKLTGF